MAGRQWLWYQLVLVFLVQGALASLKNFTIDDDADGSIQYSGNWHMECPASYLGAICIDPNKVHNRTVHWNWPSDPNGSPSSITIRFSGTAVYVYNVLADIALQAAVANIAFTLDDVPVEPYKQPPGSGGPKYLYHQLVYVNDTLSNGAHELIIIGGKSLVLFDYIKYTSESAPPPAIPPPSQSSTPSSLSSLLDSSSTSASASASTPTSMFTFTAMNSPHTTIPMVRSSNISMPMATDTPRLTTASATTATVTASSNRGSNRSVAAIAGGVVGSVLALLLLGVIMLYIRRRLSARRVGKGMGRLLDEGPPPLMDNADHFASSRGQFLRPTYPALRPSPDVPRSPGYTMSSMPTSPTSYGGEPPSRTYMNDGTVARILEKADRARTEWPSSTGTRAFPAAFGTMERW